MRRRRLDRGQPISTQDRYALKTRPVGLDDRVTGRNVAGAYTDIGKDDADLISLARTGPPALVDVAEAALEYVDNDEDAGLWDRCGHASAGWRGCERSRLFSIPGRRETAGRRENLTV